ncbi:VMAP-C domain-containing protein [Hamadaea tsunoensis]|uniref:VMAP-C domain-containing protein n=1 Tax=Hamadaea tsunoensis TaxID=53368 RepID=UPI00040F09F4|nr:trypsin-like peptidase domain-containing protein [Hamadaea tsunoensis]
MNDNNHEWHAIIGEQVGAGILVDRQHILTCAHVVTRLLDSEDEADLLGTPIQVRLKGGEDEPGATVLFVGSWREGEDDSRGDVAVIRLGRPTSRRPARFAPLSWPTIEPTARYVAFGYPPYADSGVPAELTLSPAPRANGVQLLSSREAELVHLESGFSGAGVYDVRTAQVIGMVTQAMPLGNGALGRMLPTEVLMSDWAPLGHRLRLGQYDATAYAELRGLLLRATRVRGGNLVPWLKSRVHGLPELSDPRMLDQPMEVVEWLATQPLGDPEKINLYMSTLLRHIGDQENDLRPDLDGWIERHARATPAAVPVAPAYEEPAESERAWIVVRSKPVSGPDATSTERWNRVTVWVETDRTEEGHPVVFDEDVRVADLRETVQQQLDVAIDSYLPDAGGAVTVEFVLPPDDLADPVETWGVANPFGEGEAELGVVSAVVVRGLARFERGGSPQPEWDDEDQQVIRTAPRPREEVLAVLEWLLCPAEPRTHKEHVGWLASKRRVARGLGLSGPAAAREPVADAVSAGVPVILWRRESCPRCISGNECLGARLRDRLGEEMAASPYLPEALRELRAAAAQDPDMAFAAGVSLLWEERTAERFRWSLPRRGTGHGR